MHRSRIAFAFLFVLCIRPAFADETPRPTRSERVPMRDGVELATDVYLPPGDGPFPVVLSRTPYDKSNPRMLRGIERFAKKGYALVLQDTRGRFASKGRNHPFIGEIFAGHEDGADTLAWIGKQPWCNGKVGMFGGSALGMTQLWAAVRDPQPLHCQHINVAPTSFYHHMTHPGGIFRDALMTSWVTKNQFEDGTLAEWRSHPMHDDYWKARNLEGHFAKVNVPALHVGGYYDIFIEGTIAGFNAYQFRGGEGARGKQKLLLGPWTHQTMIPYSGILKFDNAAKPDNNVHDMFRWFDRYLKGMDNGLEREATVTYYVMGDVDDADAPGKVWRTADQWPPGNVQETAYFLHANLAFSPAKPAKDGEVTYRFDPDDPAPTVGGMQLFGGVTAGTQDQRPLESRKDARVFSTPPLDKPLEIAGQVRVELEVSSDAPDTDFFVKLCDVYPDGRSINVCEGQLRARYRDSFEKPALMEPGRRYKLVIPLSHTAVAFNRGHRLRVIVTSSSAPGFEVNPNTGREVPGGARVANNTIHTGPEASRVILPVMR